MHSQIDAARGVVLKGATLAVYKTDCFDLAVRTAEAAVTMRSLSRD